MKNIKAKLVSAVLSSVIILGTVFTFIPGKNVNADTGLNSFVTRLYNVTLDRDPDNGGLNYWADELSNRRATGISCAYDFLFSNEFTNKGMSNAEYLQHLYEALMGRSAYDVEINYWLGTGLDRTSLFAEFANSDEFYNICNSYGIVAGTYESGFEVHRTASVNLFVERLYTKILGRNPDKGGLRSWTMDLLSGRTSGTTIAYNFVFSDEYCAKNKSDSDYVRDLYQAFMGREADEGGLTYYTKNMIEQLWFDKTVFNQFAQSDEFRSICDSYGISIGSAVSGGKLSARASMDPYFRYASMDFSNNTAYRLLVSVLYGVGGMMSVRGHAFNTYASRGSYHSSADPNSVNTFVSMGKYPSNTNAIHLWLKVEPGASIPCHYMWYYSPTGAEADARPLSEGFMTVTGRETYFVINQSTCGNGKYYLFITDPDQNYLEFASACSVGL